MMKSQRVAAFCSILNGAIALPEYQYHTKYLMLNSSPHNSSEILYFRS